MALDWQYTLQLGFGEGTRLLMHGKKVGFRAQGSGSRAQGFRV